MGAIKSLVARAARAAGYEVRRLPSRLATPGRVAEHEHLAAEAGRIIASGADRIHYGCGEVLLGDGWVNTDLVPAERVSAAPGVRYFRMDATRPHPFADGVFRFAFAEDFLEHLDQEQSIRFLVEARRTLRPGGVLRLSFPGLEGVLAKHYRPPTFETAALATTEAYAMFGHLHFYSFEELRLVAGHVGFSAVERTTFGLSRHGELCGLDTRSAQAELNTYAELSR